MAPEPAARTMHLEESRSDHEQTGGIMFDYLHIMLNARLAKIDERGASAVEYGLLIAGIAALIVVIVFAFGNVLRDIFQTTCNSVGQSSGGSC